MKLFILAANEPMVVIGKYRHLLWAGTTRLACNRSTKIDDPTMRARPKDLKKRVCPQCAKLYGHILAGQPKAPSQT